MLGTGVQSWLVVFLVISALVLTAITAASPSSSCIWEEPRGT